VAQQLKVYFISGIKKKVQASRDARDEERGLDIVVDSILIV